MTLYEAVFLKRTVRKFTKEPLDQKLLDQLLHFAGHLPMLCEGQRVTYKIVSSLKGGSLPCRRTGKGAPCYFLIYGDGSEECLLNAGFLMGQLGLYLLTKAIGSRFVRCPVKEDKAGASCLFIMPFGRMERSFLQDDQREKEKKAAGGEVLSRCVVKEKPGAELLTVLKAAFLSPSYFIQYPWRLVVYADRLHIFLKRDILLFPKYRRAALIDTGLMLANAFTAAEEVWLEAGFEKKERVALKEVKKHEYAGTITLH